MRKSIALSLLGLAAVGAQAQEVGRVISTTPVIQQVAVPRQVCSQQPVAVQQQPSGVGALAGAVGGAALGNHIGDGSGRAAATIIGLIGGAMLGNRIENPGTTVQNVQQCTTQTFYENRAVSYNVVYEFAGKQYTVNMPHDPGPTVRLQVTPISSAPPVEQAPMAPMAPMAPVAPVAPAAPGVVTSPVVIAPPPTIVTETVVVPAYGYRPVYRPYYYAPPPVSLHLGYIRHSGGHRHRHWR